MIIKDIRKKSAEELIKLLDEICIENFKLRMQLSTGQLPNHNKVRESRKNIAIIKTILNEKRLDNGTK